MYLLKGICVPDTGLGSVAIAVNRVGPTFLGLTFHYGRWTLTDI